MSDRVIVMREGHMTAHFSRAEATQGKIIFSRNTGCDLREPTVTCRNKHPPVQACCGLSSAFREAGISIFILILVFAVTLRAPSFLTADNFNDILLNISIFDNRGAGADNGHYHGTASIFQSVP